MIGTIINASGIIALFIRQHHAGDGILIGDAKLPYRHSDASALTTVVDDDCALVFPAHAAVNDELAVCQKLFSGAAAQGRKLLMQIDEVTVVLDQLKILETPRISPAVVRVSPSADSCFVTII